MSLDRVIARLILLMLALVCEGCGNSPPKNASPAPSSTPDDRNASEIEGQVTLSDSSDSAGVQVYIPGSSALAMTDQNGAFLLRGVFPGSHTIMAQKFGYQTAKLGEVAVPVSAPPKRYVIAPAVLDPAHLDPTASSLQFGSIRGSIVLGSNLQPADDTVMSDSRVELEGTGMKTLVERDGSFFVWNVRAGDYTLVARVPGFPDYRVAVKVRPSEAPTNVEILISDDETELEPREITGNVELVRLDGSLAEEFGGVVITLSELPGRKISPAPDGSFFIGALARQIYTLRASAPGFSNADEEEVDLTDFASAVVTLTLFETEPGADKPGVVSGRAFYEGDAVSSHAGIQVALAGTSFVAMTNSAGEYRITGIPPGTYEIIAQAPDHESAQALDVEVLPDDETPVEDLFLVPIRDYPVVVSTDPADGTRDVLLQYQMPVLVRFSKKMDAASVKASVILEPPAPVSLFMGREHPLSDYDLLVVVLDGSDPVVPVRYDQNYRLTILDGALDAGGLALQQPFSMTFRTGKPGVMDTRPPNGTKEAVVNSSNPVYFRFNARLDHGSIDARDIRIKPGVTGVPTVNFYDDPKTGWTTIEIQSQWRADTQFEVTLPRRIKTASGQSLGNTPYKLDFRTAKAMPVSVPGTSSGSMRLPPARIP